MLVAAPGITLSVTADGLQMEHPAWDYVVRASPLIVDLLYRARVPATEQALHAALAKSAAKQGLQSPAAVIAKLVEVGALSQVPDGAEAPAALPVPWNYWGSQTWQFHARAHRTKFMYDETAIWLEKVGRDEPGPDRTPRYAGGAGAREFDLSVNHGQSAIARLFATRRTRRHFSGDPLPLASIAELVSETFRVRTITDADYFGMLPLKSYPSSGARHEIDTYVIALNVLGLPGGLYYYDDYRDVLIETPLALEVAALEAALARQGMTDASAALIVAVCHAERLAWKYRDPRGYLDAFTDAGHAMQNAVLYAESLGIGAWLTTAVESGDLSALMKLDEGEFPLAVLALGALPVSLEGTRE